jgi:KaiC/GvpD/RAD55 family RecA-like ATPase
MVPGTPLNGDTTLPEARVSTGNAELDMMLSGGFVARRPYLIVGPSGTGKTKLALSFLCEGVRRGENVLLVTLEEPPNELKINHAAIAPLLDHVYVFDAIPDVMRYERAPFKDISAVRRAVPFSEVPYEIRKTAELRSVEVTFTALEQTLKMEIVRRNYSRLVIDSLTALQYFCMKGVDEVVGAQTFLRFLTDLNLTTVLTVELPVEETETAERLLARGEIRLSRWEADDRTVRAISVEKFRGSAHDHRLHPYRLSATGLDIDLATTVSRGARRPATQPATTPGAAGGSSVRTAAPALEAEALVAAMRDLAAVGIDVSAAQAEIEAARATSRIAPTEAANRHLLRARSIMGQLALDWENAAARGVASNGSGTDSRAPPAAAATGELGSVTSQVSVDRTPSPVAPEGTHRETDRPAPTPARDSAVPSPLGPSTAAPTMEDRLAPPRPGPASGRSPLPPVSKKKARAQPPLPVGRAPPPRVPAPPEASPVAPPAEPAAPAAQPSAPATPPKRRASRRRRSSSTAPATPAAPTPNATAAQAPGTPVAAEAAAAATPPTPPAGPELPNAAPTAAPAARTEDRPEGTTAAARPPEAAAGGPPATAAATASPEPPPSEGHMASDDPSEPGAPSHPSNAARTTAPPATAAAPAAEAEAPPPADSNTESTDPSPSGTVDPTENIPPEGSS